LGLGFTQAGDMGVDRLFLCFGCRTGIGKVGEGPPGVFLASSC
jgi:hypothetical protein